MTVYAFDFDRTLTTKDTFVEFIKYMKGRGKTFVGFLLFSPLLILMKLHLFPNWKAKQLVFTYFFKGMEIDEFNRKCSHFAQDCNSLLRPKGFETIQKAIEEGNKVAIISASIDNWVRPFFDEFGENIHIIGTHIEIKDGKLTGRFATKNCYGPEKVNRFKALFPNRDTYNLIAFGDSRGDKELLNYADQRFFQPFRQ